MKRPRKPTARGREREAFARAFAIHLRGYTVGMLRSDPVNDALAMGEELFDRGDIRYQGEWAICADLAEARAERDALKAKLAEAVGVLRDLRECAIEAIGRKTDDDCKLVEPPHYIAQYEDGSGRDDQWPAALAAAIDRAAAVVEMEGQ